MEEFPVPSEFQDLERAPYNLHPYPDSFDDTTEASRADSFDALLDFCDAEEATVLDYARLQAFYTLVRKSSSLAPSTRGRLLEILGSSLQALCGALDEATETLPPSFRASFAGHLYLFYSLFFLLESHKDLLTATQRSKASQTLLTVSQTMTKRAGMLWERAVADEALLFLPCKLSYLWIERTATLTARKALGDAFLSILVVTVEGFPETTLPSMSATLMDLLHSHEHAATLVAELADLLTNPALIVDLLQETARLNGALAKNVGPFLAFVAQRKPKLVLQQLSQLVSLLDQEAYQLRSSLVTAIGYVLVDSPNDVKLLDLLHQRAYDVSSFTRSAVLKAWGHLVEQGALQPQRFTQVTALALDRLQDKTVLVRKQAMQLLTLLLERNPYGPNLQPEQFSAALQATQQSLLDNLPEALKESYEAAIVDVEDPKDIQRATLLALADEQPDDANVQAYQFAQSALEFIALLEDSALLNMLLSNTPSDVAEALKFYVQARHFGLPCAVLGMKHALTLLWSADNAEPVLKAFRDVFLAQPNEELLPDEEIAKNLVHLVDEATPSELASIDQAIGRLVQKQEIPPNVFYILWSMAQNPSALKLLAMAAKADRGIVDSKSRLKYLLGLLEDAGHDWKWIAAAATCLKTVERARVNPSDAKYLISERLLDTLSAVVRANSDESPAWFAAAQASIEAIFGLSPEPELVMQEALQAMRPNQSQLDLARFLFVVGHTALQLLVYTETLSGCVRRANAQKAQKKQAEATSMEDELGLAAEADAANERTVLHICEQEILGEGLIGACVPVVIRVVKNEGDQFGSEVVQQAALLALCKFMCVSRTFCKNHLDLLFVALARAPLENEVLRANTVIAVGDLAFRFPNEFEPYTPRLYACLRDSSTKVRRHALMVLTHLILKDMVKVKGQVCEIALCLRDNDQRIRDMSRLLFHELSKRNNSPVYNLLPDIISQLSQESQRTEDFRAIIAFLLGYIKKERQIETLTSKLLERFPTCTSVAQKANFTYCIYQLKMNEKSIKMLSDSFKVYKDALHDPDVSKYFSAIASKAKKFMKPEMKPFLDEWENKLKEHAELGAENERAGANASKAKKRATRRNRSRRNQLAEIQEQAEGDDA